MKSNWIRRKTTLKTNNFGGIRPSKLLLNHTLYSWTLRTCLDIEHLNSFFCLWNNQPWALNDVMHGFIRLIPPVPCEALYKDSESLHASLHSIHPTSAFWTTRQALWITPSTGSFIMQPYKSLEFGEPQQFIVAFGSFYPVPLVLEPFQSVPSDPPSVRNSQLYGFIRSSRSIQSTEPTSSDKSPPDPVNSFLSMITVSDSVDASKRKWRQDRVTLPPPLDWPLPSLSPFPRRTARYARSFLIETRTPRGNCSPLSQKLPFYLSSSQRGHHRSTGRRQRDNDSEVK